MAHVAAQPARRVHDPRPDPRNEDLVNVIATAVARANSGGAEARDDLFLPLYDELHRLALFRAPYPRRARLRIDM